ncbi:sensor histidine kinase [Halobacteriaceae archaeon GCM10025711]
MFLFLALGNIGAGAGALTGITRAQAVRSARHAERARTAADLAEQERKRLRYLNHVLRHHVLNGMNVIRGHADRLDRQVGANHEDVEPILRRSERIVELVQNVRTLVQSLEDEFDPEPIPLREVLESELVAARTAYPDADFDVVGSVPAVDVRADDGLPLLFENLLSNAVEHNDNPVPGVQVSVEKQGVDVVVRVADDGPGIPEEVVQDLRRDPADLARGETVGLYLVRVLVDRYDGDIWPEQTDASGTTVAVELPVVR